MNRDDMFMKSFDSIPVMQAFTWRDIADKMYSPCCYCSAIRDYIGKMLKALEREHIIEGVAESAIIDGRRTRCKLYIKVADLEDIIEEIG